MVEMEEEKGKERANGLNYIGFESNERKQSTRIICTYQRGKLN